MQAEQISTIWDCLSKMGANTAYLKRLDLSREDLLQFYLNVKRITQAHSPIETTTGR